MISGEQPTDFETHSFVVEFWSAIALVSLSGFAIFSPDILTTTPVACSLESWITSHPWHMVGAFSGGILQLLSLLLNEKWFRLFIFNATFILWAAFFISLAMCANILEIIIYFSVLAMVANSFIITCIKIFYNGR